ncbi:hypothetical protein M408DRAFT_18856 [Serendipita vermifera MAFF 305830]|uniref:Ribosome recycling factor domain-containing protein n=1 Tax=Serendipita vermifera MAFF 305830 TaxID=933852 RepID=A0A0C2X6Y8_SERVB|nr:hypothetical protein M408DRAFT_18856 [Serendipita vermifera MAFF 305830]
MLAHTLIRRTTCRRALVSSRQTLLNQAYQAQTRSYAKRRQAVDEEGDGHDFVYHKGKKGKAGKDVKHADEVILDKNNITDPSLRFVPSSSMPHGAAYDAEEKSADEKMGSSVRWLKETARGVEVRSNGRVVPDVLDSVRVRIRLDEGDGEGGDEMEVGLKEVATVGVKNGNVLVVTVFEEQTLKAVEKALYAAKLPGLTPQRSDARTILLPVSQPTVESRNALVASLQKQAEEAKIAIRKVHQASQKKVKALGFEAKSAAMTDLTALVNKRIEEVDKIVEQTKKAVSK